MDDPTDDLRGATVNERLVLTGLMDEYEQAARDRDAERIVVLLVRTRLPRAAAEQTVAAVLAQQEFYGF